MGLLTVQEAESLRSVGRISTDDVALQDGVIYALAADTSTVTSHAADRFLATQLNALLKTLSAAAADLGEARLP